MPGNQNITVEEVSNNLTVAINPEVPTVEHLNSSYLNATMEFLR